MDLSDFTAALLERIDLPQLVSERMTLKKAGTTYTGCCPFHDEKTPSFHVYHQSHPPHYHCYGCGAHGDAISFVRELDNLGFMEALEKLAARTGMEVPRTTRQNETQQPPQRALYDLMQEVSQRYADNLEKHPQRQVALDYLRKRGVSDEMITLYGIGFAPNDRQWLSRETQATRLQRLQELRLVGRREDSTLYDLFANRLMFPIRDSRGRTVAFGGRTLGQDRSKYLNSPEMPIFHKSSELYGLWETRQRHRQNQRLIIVEGYLDVIALTQFGIPGAVATLGTATNEDNLSHLIRVSSDLVFCFDGDAAGLAAADKAMMKILPLYQQGLQVHFLILPQGEDPDTFIRSSGREAFQERLAQAAPLSQHFFTALGRDLNVDIPEQRLLLRKRAMDILESIKGTPLYPALRELTMERTRSPLWSSRQKGSVATATLGHGAIEPSRTTSSVKAWTVRSIALQCLMDPAWHRHALFLLEASGTEPDIQALQHLLAALQDQGIDDRAALLTALATQPALRELVEQLTQGLSSLPASETLLAEASDALSRLRQRLIDQRLEHLKAALQNQPENEELKQAFRSLLNEKQGLNSRGGRG